MVVKLQIHYNEIWIGLLNNSILAKVLLLRKTDNRFVF
jgi:uncharacterized protein YciU (UPF0263 family)